MGGLSPKSCRNPTLSFTSVPLSPLSTPSCSFCPYIQPFCYREKLDQSIHTKVLAPRQRLTGHMDSAFALAKHCSHPSTSPKRLGQSPGHGGRRKAKKENSLLTEHFKTGRAGFRLQLAASEGNGSEWRHIKHLCTCLRGSYFEAGMVPPLQSHIPFCLFVKTP